MDDSRSTLHDGASHPAQVGLGNDGWTAVQAAVGVPSVDGDQPEDELHAARILSEPRKENTSWVARFGEPYWEA